MSGLEVEHVRLPGYVRTRGRTCLVKSDLAVSGKCWPNMSGKGADMSGHIRTKKT
jgi:hypothetical protein